jgi:hypothetical protein
MKKNGGSSNDRRVLVPLRGRQECEGVYTTPWHTRTSVNQAAPKETATAINVKTSQGKRNRDFCDTETVDEKGEPNDVNKADAIIAATLVKWATDNGANGKRLHASKSATVIDHA